MPKAKSPQPRKAVITITESGEDQIDVKVTFHPEVKTSEPTPISAGIALKCVKYISELAAGR